jgi:hypothetical protein
VSRTMEGMCQKYVHFFFQTTTRGDSEVATENESQPGRVLQDEITISGPASDSSNPGPPSEIISTQLQQSSAADCEAKRKRRCKNGNVPPREGKAGGKNLDQTCPRLPIEWPGTTSGGRATVHYFRIACDKFRANNSRSCAFEHAGQCNVSMEFNIMELI